MNPIAAAIADAILAWHEPGVPLIVGLCGTQASGKTTACAQVAAHLESLGLMTGVMSLDDLYLGREARALMAETAHPLFATRGPPGTHDIPLGLAVLDAVRDGRSVALPRFSKAMDEPLLRSDWPQLADGCDIFLFEGWCVGARAQADVTLAEPVNALEREEDPDGVWRRSFTHYLRGTTGELFARLSRLIYLRPPSFDIVYRWRCQQEHEMIAAAGPDGAPRAMSDAAIARFIAHYERMTRWIAEDMPGYADMTIQLGDEREILSIDRTNIDMEGSADASLDPTSPRRLGNRGTDRVDG